MAATRWAVGAILLAAGCGVASENGDRGGDDLEPSAAGRAALTAGTGANQSGSSAVFFVENASWADIHYQLNGAGPQNVRMTNTGTHNEYTLANLTTGATVNYNFTYFDLGCSCAHDSAPALYVQGGGTGGTTGGGTTGGGTTGGGVDQGTPYPTRTITHVPTTGGSDLSRTVASLYSNATALEAASVVDTPSALITRVGDRVRDRHAREAQFHIYEHFLPLYFKDRTYAVEIVDTVAKEGTSITLNLKTQSPQDKPNIRAFFRGITTVAEYFSNEDFTQITPTSYTSTLTFNGKEGRAIRVGDRMEMEVGIFLAPPFEGRFNYYSSVFLYVVGSGGIQPFEGRGSTLDSFPLSATALQGGGTTLSYPYSNEPNLSFMQMATSMAAGSAQPWVEGRRLLHTDFITGEHSEPENPVFTEQANKVGPRFVATRCVSCHANNGRALPPALNTTLTTYAMKVGVVTGAGTTAVATSHPALGSSIQPMSRSGAPEGTAQIRAWATTTGTMHDGTPFELRAPRYSGKGPLPAAYSARISPQIIGVGLLEAVPESTIAAMVDANDANNDGISGRMQVVTDKAGKTRMGRFGWKGAQPTVMDQIASALNREMGVTSSLFPSLDCGSTQTGCASSATPIVDTDLAKLARYNALLGVPARRNLTDAQALAGEALFTSAGCASCHTTTLTTSAFHPFAELRGQTVHPYTDLLLHDMGDDLADNLPEGVASGSEWRTPPLWGIGHTADVSGGEAYLHDGRARSLTEAILWHGGEAERVKFAFVNMNLAQRASILAFLKAL